MGNIYPGYRGLADIGTIGIVRFGDANISAKQAVETPDLIMGDWDHDAYVYGKIEVGGSISGPVTETFVSGSAGGGLWDWGVKRSGDCGILSDDSIDLYYYCGGTEPNHRQFTGMLVNSLNFSCAAGEVAQFNIDVMGSGAGAWTNTNPPHYTDAEKLITWDKVNVTLAPGSEFKPPDNIAYSNFDFTINNNLEAKYALNQSAAYGLFPYEIVPGLRTISGSISVYNTPQANGYDKWDDYTAAGFGTISFDIGGLAITMNARFHRVEPISQTGAITSTIAFTGVGSQAGLDA